MVWEFFPRLGILHSFFLIDSEYKFVNNTRSGLEYNLSTPETITVEGPAKNITQKEKSGNKGLDKKADTKEEIFEPPTYEFEWNNWFNT